MGFLGVFKGFKAMAMAMAVAMSKSITMVSLVLLLLFHPKFLISCYSLNSQGLALLKFREKVVNDPFNALSNWGTQGGDFDHCSWFGVLCSDGQVVVLNLKDLCLGGTLTPELANLPYIKSIILRNNSFSGIIPPEIGHLKELEVLDLGYNNFSGTVPSNLGNNFSLSILLLDNNEFLGSLSPELNLLQVVSEHQVDESQLSVTTSSQETCSGTYFPGYFNRPEPFVGRTLLQARPVEMASRMTRKKRSSASFQPPSVATSPKLSPSPTSSRSRSTSHSPFHKLSFRSSPSPPSSPPPTPSQSRSKSTTHSASHKSSSRSSPSPSTPPPTPSRSRSKSTSHSHSHKSRSRPSPSPAPLPPSALAAPSSSPLLDSPSPVASSENPKVYKASRVEHHKVAIWSSIAGGSVFLILSAVAIIICRSSRVATVKPWATGMSGQLQKAFVSGVPKLNRSELEIACEDFSNIIGSLDDGTVYKGTLSNGVEIAVISSTVKSKEKWSRNLEAQFRNKIETLSKVNHKNFVNLIGCCEDENPFTRMMVFEYAPNGTLFEHLHIKEAERLDWNTRLRIIMGMAYCFEHMHQQDPPIPHRDLQSGSIYLSEDYAAKVSDFSFWNEETGGKMRSPSLQLLEATTTDKESNVFNFGVLLFEVISGRMPFLEDNCTLADWVLDCLDKDHISQDFVDPTLSWFDEEKVQRLLWIIRDCMHPDPNERPKMSEVAARLREITRMGPDGTTPKLSPLWWAELEVLSMEADSERG